MFGSLCKLPLKISVLSFVFVGPVKILISAIKSLNDLTKAVNLSLMAEVSFVI